MIDIITETLAVWSQSLIRASWHGALAVGVALVIECCWKNMPAVWRSWMWRLVFLKTALALVPFSFSLPLLPASDPAVFSTNEAMLSSSVVATPLAVVKTQQILPIFGLVMFVAWSAGLLFCVAALWRDAANIRKRFAESQPIVDANALRMMRVLAESMQVAKPQLRRLDDISSPCLAGFKRRPILLLPTSWLGNCSTTQLRLAMAHELAHYARSDLRWNRFVAICRAVLFFNPLLWIAARRYVAAQEMACDALALRHTSAAPAQLAHLLVQFAERQATSWVGVVAMTGTYSRTRERITAMFRFHQSSSRVAAWGLSCLAFLCLIPVSLSAQSTSSYRSESPPARPSNGFIGAYAAAGASSSARGYANGMSYGNQAGQRYGYGNPMANARARANAHARANAQARAGVAVQIGGFGGMLPRGEQPPASSYTQRPRAANGAFSMRNNMASAGAGNSNTWARNLQSTINGETVTIEEIPGKLTVTVERSDGSRETTVAADLKELSDKSPATADLYRQLVPANGIQNNNSVQDNWGGFNLWGSMPRTDARQMLQEQIEIMKAQQGFNSPLNGMLDGMLRQLN